MNVMAVLDWFFQLITNTISWLGSAEIVGGLSLLHVIIAFVLMGVVISVMVPRS